MGKGSDSFWVRWLLSPSVMVLFYVISTVKWWCHLWTIFWRHGRPRVSIYLLYMCLFHCSSCRSQRWWHHQGVKLREVQIARKRTCQVSFQRVKRGRRSFTVCHTGNKVHTLLISSHLWQNHWHFFWNPISWPTLEENIWAINNSILLLQKCIISCDASHLRLSQILSKTFLSPLCWIARQWTLRSDVWQEMSDFSSLVQDRFLTVSVASTHFRLIRSLILYSCSAADLIQKCTLTWLIDIQQKQAGSLWDVCPKTLYFMAYLQALKVCNIYNDRTV